MGIIIKHMVMFKRRLTKYFLLSIFSILEPSTFWTMTGIRSGYFWRILFDSWHLWSKIIISLHFVVYALPYTNNGFKEIKINYGKWLRYGKTVIKCGKTYQECDLPWIATSYFFSFSLCSVRESEFLVFERESYYLETSRALPHTQD